MARKTRFAPPDVACHVVNRGNERRIIFRQHFDYAAFIELLGEGVRRFPLLVFGYCLMPNHFHLLVQPTAEHALSAFMQWVTGGYACTFRQQTETIGHGHVFQRRFWNACAHDDEAFLEILRYIEANPVRACLVGEADLWPWSSLTDRRVPAARKILSPLPIELPAEWACLVTRAQAEDTIERIRKELVPKPGRPMKEARI